MFPRTASLTAALALCAGIVNPMHAEQQQPGAKPDHMQHRFDDPEKFAKQFADPARDAWQMPTRVIDSLDLKTGMAVADIGAGTGYFSMRLARVSPGLTVYSVDIEHRMVEHLQARAMSEQLGNVVPVLAGAASADLPKPVDVVLIVNTFHHINDRVAYFRDLKKSLTASGRIAIVDFRKDSPEGPPMEFRFPAEQIESEMKKAGFHLEAKHSFLSRQHFLVFR